MQIGVNLAKSLVTCACRASSVNAGASRLDQEEQPRDNADQARAWDGRPQLRPAGQVATGERLRRSSYMPAKLSTHLLDSMPLRGGITKAKAGLRRNFSSRRSRKVY